MKSINAVEEFWNNNPCGAVPYFEDIDKRKAFLAIEQERYTKQKGILAYALFDDYKGKKVLEIGCGIGTDGLQFARAGAVYTGVDMTDAAISIAKERFELFNQRGDFLKINAEKLPFADGSFDHVYSFGVIHHSCYPERIVDEIYRVLKPKGTVTIMLYNRSSFYYLIEVCFLRRIFFYICDKKLFCAGFFALFGSQRARRFENFRDKLARYKKANGFPTWEEWIAMNTDDVFCPISRVYSAKETKKLFSVFSNFKTSTWFIDKDNWFLWFVFGRFISLRMQKLLEKRGGWFRMIKAEKIPKELR